MGKYFTNEILDELWTRLVNATNNLIGDSQGSWQLEERSDDNYLSIADGYLYVAGDPWMVNSGNGITYYLYSYQPLDLTLLDTTITYNVYNDVATEMQAMLVYRVTSSLSNAGIKGIHDALLSHYGLSHENTPTTPGDYMKGIAVAARYKKSGSVDTDTLNSLETIVEYLEADVDVDVDEYEIYFDEDTSVYLKGWDTSATDFKTFYVYMNDSYLTSVQGRSDASTFLFDIADYWGSPLPGDTFIIHLGESELDSTAISNTITYTYTDEEEVGDYVVTLDSLGNYSLTPSSNDAVLVLYNVTMAEEIPVIGASAVDSGNLSGYMKNGYEYYITVSSISEDLTGGSYSSGTITYEGASYGASVDVTLSSSGVATATYTNCTPLSDSTWILYMGDEQVWKYSANGSLEVSFAEHMTTGNVYYVTISTPIEDGETVTATSNSVEYTGSSSSDNNWISIDVGAESATETYNIRIIPSYGSEVSSSETLTYTLNLYDETDSSTLVATDTYNDYSIDEETIIDVKAIYSDFIKDSYYRVEVTAVCSIDSLTDTDEAYFTWDWENDDEGGNGGSGGEEVWQDPVVSYAYGGEITLSNYTDGIYPCRVMYDLADMGETGEIQYGVIQELTLTDGTTTLNYYEPTYMSNFSISVQYGSEDYDWTDYVSFNFEGY